MDKYKMLDKLMNKKKSNSNNDSVIMSLVKSFVSKVLICLIIFMIVIIVIKINPKYKNTIYNNVYEKNFSFTKVNELYSRYFGDILPFKKIVPDDTQVFSEKIVYSSASLYKDGALLEVSDKYLVPIIEGGIVVFIGEKDDYGKTVIIQQINGIDVWYGNVNISDINIYDYVKKGQLLGEVIDKKLYLVFQKNGVYLDYKEYL